jgi:hypothetical protein
VNDPALAIGLALAVALSSAGAVSAFVAANALKKLAAVLTTLVGAALVLALLQAPSSAVLAGAAAAFAYLLAGAAIVVRLQEGYGTIESDELDAADHEDEPREAAP